MKEVAFRPSFSIIQANQDASVSSSTTVWMKYHLRFYLKYEQICKSGLVALAMYGSAGGYMMEAWFVNRVGVVTLKKQLVTGYYFQI